MEMLARNKCYKRKCYPGLTVAERAVAHVRQKVNHH